MSDEFDPYLKWLGIPPKHQPPHHYRLLGLEVFESDPDAIENAADRQMAHLRTFRSGKRVELAERLLNEIAEAKVCLLHAERKQEYDARLRGAEAKRQAAEAKTNGSGHALKAAVALADAPAAPVAARLPSGPSTAAVAAAVPPVAKAAPVAAPASMAHPTNPASTFAAPTRSAVRRRKQTPWIAIAVVGAVALGALGLAATMLPALLQSPDVVATTDDGGANTSSGSDHSTNISTGDGDSIGPRVDVPDRPPPPVPPVGETSGDGSATEDRPATNVPHRPWRGPRPWRDPRERPTTDPAGETGTDYGDDDDDAPLANPAPLPGTEDGAPGSEDGPDDAAEPAGEVAQRLAPPSAEAQKEIEARVRELYKLSNATPEQLAEVAKKLVADAKETRDNSDDQFVMYRVAAQAAAARGDVTTAMAAVDALQASFELEAMPLRLALVEQASKALLPPAERAQALRDSLAVIDAALAENKFAEVDSLTTALLTAARRLNDRDLNTELIERRKTALALRKQYDKAVAALETLKTSPDDAAANGVVGSFWAFVKNNWEQGLPHLARSDDAAQADAAQRELAQREAAEPAPGEEIAKLADDWLAIANKQDAPAKQNVLRHAQGLYGKALSEVTGLTKASVERQLAEIEKSLAAGGAAGPPAPVSRMARITASCDSAFEMYINGERVLSGRRDDIGEIDRELKSGDVILVMGSNLRGERGFAAVIKFEGDGKTIVTGQANAWFAYTPANPQAWFDPRGVAGIASAVLGDGDRHQRIEQQTGVRSQSIWGNNQFLSFFVLRIP